MKLLFLSLLSLFSINFLGAMEPEEPKPMRDARSLKANCARFLLAHPEIATVSLPHELQEYMELEKYASGSLKEFCTPEGAQAGFHEMVRRGILSKILLQYLRSLNPQLSIDSPLFNLPPIVWTPLMVAIRAHYPRNAMDAKMVSFLLENGADVNYQIPSGETVLHMAIRSPIDAVQLLLDWGANPLITNANLFSARDLASMFCSHECAQLLEKAEKHRAAIDQVRTNKNIVGALCNREIGKKN